MAETPKKKVAPVDIGDSELEARIAQDLEQAKDRNRKLRVLGAKTYQVSRGAGLRGKALGLYDKLDKGFYLSERGASIGKAFNDASQDINEELNNESFQAQLLQQQQQQAALEKQKEGGLSESIKNRIAARNKKPETGMKARMQKATAKMLSFAWEIMIESFGSAIVIIDVIWFFRLIMGDSFCKLGHEWVPEQIKKLNPTKAEALGERLSILENIGCGCINGCCGLVAMIVIAILAAILGFFENPIGTFFEVYFGS
jgi:hypothetical protein